MIKKMTDEEWAAKWQQMNQDAEKFMVCTGDCESCKKPHRLWSCADLAKAIKAGELFTKEQVEKIKLEAENDSRKDI